MEDEEDILKIMIELKIQSKQKEAAGSLFYYLIKHRIEPEAITDKLLELLFAPDKTEQNGGFLAVNKILEVGRETKVLHFVTAIMPQIFKYIYQYDIAMMYRAAECLGNLAQSGGNSTAENVESHIDTCFEWIRNRPPKMHIFGASDSKLYNKKFAAILVLTQFCDKMPTLAYNKLVSTGNYQKLFSGLQDSKLEVRQATVQFFRSINKLIIQRDPNERRNFYEWIYNNAINAFSSSDQNFMHGSLLVLNFLLTESDDLIKDKYEELFKNIIQLSEKKSSLIQPQCIDMFPIMAEYGQATFLRYSSHVIKFLLEISESKTSVKGNALKALGKLSVIIDKSKFDKKYVEHIVIAAGKEIAASKSTYFTEALDTIANLCKVQGEELDRITDIIDLINVLFKEGLSSTLIMTLNELSKINNYQYRKPIQIKLLNVISLVLSGRQFSFSRNIATFRKFSDEGRERSGREASLESGSILLNSNEARSTLGELNSMEKETMKKLMNREVDGKIKQIIQSENKDLMIKLALATLSSFDFSDFAESLTHFFDEVVLNFLDNSNDEIREAAVKTCSNLTISRDGNRIGSVLEKILKKLLKRFLIVATTDANHSIRCNMLKHMSSQFDCYLSSRDNLVMLFNCMNDSSFEIRDRTLKILGRLADSNKAIMYPYLRNLLVTLMSTIEYKGDPKEKEEAIKILNTFVKKCKRVVKDHVESLLKSLLNKMYEKDFNYSLLPDIIEAIGQLSSIDGKPIIPYLNDLIPLILDCIKDEISPRKREIGLKVLIMIIENTGYVVKPYFHYPEIIQLIQNLVQNETNFSVRKLVYKLLGTAGALDPYLLGKILVFISVEEDEELALNLPLLKEIDVLKKYAYQNSIENLSKRALMESKEINSDMKLQSLSASNTEIPLQQLGLILENPTLRDIHKTVLGSYKYIFKSLKNETKCYLNLIFPPLLSVIKQTKDDNIRKEAFEVLKNLIIQIREHIARYSTSLFSLINEFFSSEASIRDKLVVSKSSLDSSAFKSSNLGEIIEIIGTLNNHAHAYVKEYIYFLIPKVLQVIEKAKKHNVGLAHKCIGLLLSIQSNMLDDYLYLLIPEMINICGKNESRLKESALHLLLKVYKCKHFEEYMVQIVHSFLKILDETNDKGYIVKFLLELGTKVGHLFSPFLLLVLNCFKKNKIPEEEYETQLQNIVYNNSFNYTRSTSAEMEQMYRQEDRMKTVEELAEESKKDVEEHSLRKDKNYNFDDLLREFEKHRHCKIHDDWIDWLKKTSYHLLKQNPSPLLYACSSVAEMYMPIISELYNIAFVI